jgi:thioredoxin reductase (NADPH)
MSQTEDARTDPKHGEFGMTGTETPDLHGAFPRLSDPQIARLAVRGEYRKVDGGAVLYAAGETSDEFFVVISGHVSLVDGTGGECVHGPGRLLGEPSLLTGQAASATAVVREPGEVLAVPEAQIREIVGPDPALSDLILRAYLQRRSVLIGLGAGLRVIGSRFSVDTRRLRDFAARNRIPYRWTDLEEDVPVEELLRALGLTPQETPVVIWRGEKVLRNPSNGELARAIGRGPPSFREAIADLAVVGAGPAGLAAAMYTAADGLRTVLLDSVATGGQAATSTRIENYLGFPTGIAGADLAERARMQAERFGTAVTVPGEVTALEGWDGRYTLRLAASAPVRARNVLIATGARYRRLDLPDLQRFERTGVYYAATPIEAQSSRGAPVVVVGGGNSAGQAAVFLAHHAVRVYLVVRGRDLAGNMSRYLIDRIARTDRIEVLTSTEVRSLVGDPAAGLSAVRVSAVSAGPSRQLDARALFVFIGARPHTAWLDGAVALDRHGFIRTGSDVPEDATAAPRSLLETSLPSVFAAGDVRSGSTKRVASAVTEGTTAARLILATHR